MVEDKYTKSLLKLARSHGWLSAQTKIKFDEIAKANLSVNEKLKRVKQNNILNEGQLEQLQALVEDEDLKKGDLARKESIFYAKNVSKSYDTVGGKVRALKNIDLIIYQGEILGILGFSGSGKSTLLNILGLLSTPDKNSKIYFNGFSYATMKPKQRDLFREKHFGFIFQESHLLSHLSAIENVALPLRLQNYSTKECLRKSEEMLSNFMTDGEKKDKKLFYSKKPNQLSGGQKQRIAASRALVHSPEVIFADEPTGNLDFDTGQMVMKILLKEAQEKHTTVILVTHNPSQARQYCDRFFWLENGLLKKKLSGEMQNTMIFMKQLSGKDFKDPSDTKTRL